MLIFKLYLSHMWRLRNFLDVKTETHRDWKTWMLRLRNFMDVETETSRGWTKDVDTETPSRVLLIYGVEFCQQFNGAFKTSITASYNNVECCTMSLVLTLRALVGQWVGQLAGNCHVWRSFTKNHEN